MQTHRALPLDRRGLLILFFAIFKIMKKYGMKMKTFLILIPLFLISCNHHAEMNPQVIAYYAGDEKSRLGK